jgi:hypothetical protein
VRPVQSSNLDNSFGEASMSNTNTGGPAFPTEAYDLERQTLVREEGMTLRDYFAAKAMQSTLADNAYAERTETPAEWLAIVSKASYEMADAMLKARDA